MMLGWTHLFYLFFVLIVQCSYQNISYYVKFFKPNMLSTIITKKIYSKSISADYESTSTKITDSSMFDQSIVVCGPSGVGKGTIISKILEKYPNQIALSVSHTSRSPRVGEIDGYHYHFVSKDFMVEKTRNTQDENAFFIEYAEVHGNLYGTSYDAVKSIQSKGKICLLDVDVNGVKKIRESKRLPAYCVFITPPSLEVLEARLKKRGTESEGQLEIRLKNAKCEIEYGLQPGSFDLVIVNDKLNQAIEKLDQYIQKCFPSFFCNNFDNDL